MAATDAGMEVLMRQMTWLEPLNEALARLVPPSIAEGLDAFGSTVLSAYAPDLPPSAYKNAELPMMRGSQVFLVILLYMQFIGGSVYMLKGSNPQSSDPAKKEVKPLLQKLGLVFIIQAIYNVLQVVVCSFLVLRVLDVLREENYSFVCNRFNLPSRRMADTAWAFYMLKYFDLLDTAFMILRGNWRQLSFLHVYHHSSVIYISWVNAAVGFEGDIYLVILLNSFVHVVMYAYYLMASLNIPLARLLKYSVTKMQMTQFLCMVAHGVYHIYFSGSCPYPLRVTTGYLFYVTSLYILFNNFSKKTYAKHQVKQGSESRLKAQ